MPLPSICFNPENKKIREFLETLEIPDRFIDQGCITEADTKKFNFPVGYFALHALADLEKDKMDQKEKIFRSGGIDVYTPPIVELGEKEAEKANALWKFNGSKMMSSVFKQNHECPYERDILYNLLGLNFNTRILGSVIPYICHYDPNYLTANLVMGIYYSQNQVPNHVATAAKSVFQIMHSQKTVGGSAVLISREGDLLTAYHVLYDETDHFVPDAVLRSHSGEIPLEEKHVKVKNKELDLLQLHVPALSRKTYLEVGPKPPTWEELWAIGYPAQALFSLEHAQPLATIGTLNTIYPTKPFLATLDMRVTDGNSGGPVIDQQGRLFGIVVKNIISGRNNIELAINIVLKHPSQTIVVIPPPSFLREASKK